MMFSLMILTLMVRRGEMTPTNITTTTSYERLVVDSDNISQQQELKGLTQVRQVQLVNFKASRKWRGAVVKETKREGKENSHSMWKAYILSVSPLSLHSLTGTYSHDT